MKSIRFILKKNIICGNALDYKTKEGNPIEFTHWSMQIDGMVIQNLFDFYDKANVKDGMQSLFADTSSLNRPKTKHFLKLYENEK